MKERKSLEKIVLKYKEFLDLEKNIEDLKELSKDSDPEIKEMARMELDETEIKYDQVIEEIKVLLIPKDPNDDKNVIMEIRGAAGGDEANIFAADLFRMYSKFAESRGWKIEITNSQPTGLGGFSIVEFMVSGA